MSDKFQNKYRIQLARLQHWDYGWNASYFITICTKDREHFFGEITDGEMQLSEIGKLADDFWQKIPQHFNFAQLGNFEVLPNHVHGILIIDKSDNVNESANVKTPNSQFGRLYLIPNKKRYLLPVKNPKPNNPSWKNSILQVHIS